jgi:hypothetical protein
VTSASGDPVAALCYVAWQLADGKPGREYLEKMLSVAREYSFPEDYIRHIQSFV